MTRRKFDEASEVATEDAVLGYHPPSSMTRLNGGDVPDDEDDLITDDDFLMRVTLGELRSMIVIALKRT